MDTSWSVYAVHLQWLSASLVIMISDDKKQLKIERYSGSTVRQTI